MSILIMKAAANRAEIGRGGGAVVGSPVAAGLPGGPHEIGTRGSFGDLGATVADLLGVEVPGLVGESFADRIGFP